MNFLTDFISYFMGDLVLPDWLLAFIGFSIIVLFVKLLFVLLGK